tara:strand:+ start:712 stop:927 length:216 start_codon:yes stop_codon:yes gene_type:complete
MVVLRSFLNMSLNELQIKELTEYIEELIDLYSEDEYEVYLENIVYHYCNRKFNIEREKSTELLYKVIEQLK